MTRRLLADERGSGAAELALLTPALVALLMITVLAFRVTQADAEVADVAAEAARAASLERTPGAAADAAQNTAAANLAAGGITCTNLTVATNTGAFAAGGGPDRPADHQRARHPHPVRDRPGGSRPLPRSRDVTSRLRPDSGGIATTFAAGIAIGLLAVIALVGDGGRLLSGRRQASDVASGAARAAAQEVDLQTFRQTGDVVLDPSAAAGAARSYLNTLGEDGSANVAGDVVTVTVTRQIDLPLLGLIGVGSRTVTATRQARAAAGIDQAEG